MKVLVLSSLLLVAVSGQYIISPYAYSGYGGLSWAPQVLSPSIVAPRLLSPVAPLAPVAPVTPVAVAPITIATSSQYHAQDELGQFAFGHRGDNQARDEVKTFDGAVRGAYSYVDPTGKLVNVQYHADSNGFRVLGANNLPVAPAVPVPVELKGPEPVSDTAEVIAARASFARTFAEVAEAAEKAPEEEKKEELKEEAVEVKAEEKKERRKRQVFLPTLTRTLLPSPIITSHVFAPLPLTKTILKTSELKPVEDAKTPAATKKAEIEVKETEIVSPFITPYHSLVYPYATPLSDPIVLTKEEKEKKAVFSPIPLTYTIL